MSRIGRSISEPTFRYSVLFYPNEDKSSRPELFKVFYSKSDAELYCSKMNNQSNISSIKQEGGGGVEKVNGVFKVMHIVH